MIAILLLACTLGAAPDEPSHAQHSAQQHAHDVDQRHDRFGMAHDASVHHFLLAADGGRIELRAKGDDEATIAAIREHLQTIAAELAKGDFTKPAFVHDTVPDGVDVMKREAGRIRYTYEELDRGGRVRITTSSPDALDAVHAFLRFQIVEHRTGDSGEVETARK